jgi:hypothetical protein
VDGYRCAVIATAFAAVLVGGCSSADTTSTVAVATTPRATPSLSPDAASAFIDLAAHDRQTLISAYNGVVAACPFATQDGRVIAPADLAPCGLALDHLVTVTQSFQADIAQTTVPTQYTTQAATMRDGLQSLLAAIPAYRRVSGSRDLAAVSGPSAAITFAELEAIRAFSG